LLLIARTKGQSLSNRHIFEPLRPLATAAPSAAAPAVAAPSPAHAPSPASFAGVPAVSAGDLIEPLGFLLGRYLKYPALGRPVPDELVGNLRNTVTSRVVLSRQRGNARTRRAVTDQPL
jgi:hypothetical protein